jgi:orotidine-5'-phosphate decarboxylase
MDKQSIISQIKSKESFLCIGLDTDINKIPSHLLNEEYPLFEFNKQIIDATHDLCVAYKPNIAFYESRGKKGWESLKKTLDYIPNNIFKILDAKRGDIGNTSSMYAKAFFQEMNVDAVTLSPYMGSDSITPFLEFDNKWVILLALTSNNGSEDFQHLIDDKGRKLFENVLIKSQRWGSDQNMMYVVGANRDEEILKIREIIPEHFLLVPGVGAQGGSLHDFANLAINKDCGVLVNSSRNIIYAVGGDDFADGSRKEAKKLQLKMSEILSEKGII